MSSPARSMANVGGGSGSVILEDSAFTNLAIELTFTQDRLEDTMKGLNEDVMSALDKEVKALEADAWKFAAPRSQLHLLSRSGIPMCKGIGTTREELMEIEKLQKDGT